MDEKHCGSPIRYLKFGSNLKTRLCQAHSSHSMKGGQRTHNNQADHCSLRTERSRTRPKIGVLSALATARANAEKAIPIKSVASPYALRRPGLFKSG